MYQLIKRFAFCLFLVFTPVHLFALDFYIAPHGNDQNPGTKAKPFGTIQRAKEAVRQKIASGQRENITVYLRGGIYRTGKTIIFDLKDAAKNGFTITYCGYPGEKPVISGSKKLGSWKKPEADPDFLPEKARGQVWYVDLEKEADFKMLYQNGVALPRSRSAGFMPIQNKTGADNRTLILPENFPVKTWENSKGVEVLIRPTFAWTMNILPVESVDTQTKVVRTTIGGTYPLDPQPQWSLEAHHITETCWLENSIAFIDKPGAWALDKSTGRLWLWPVNGLEPTHISAPVCTELFLIRGEVSDDKPADRPVTGLIFKDLTFVNNDRYTWTNQERGFQHDWSAVDQGNAMLRFRGAENCQVTGCEFKNGGTAAIRLDLQCRYNRIEGNHIQYVGEHGIALCGYGPGTKDVNHSNEIRNNNIHHVGQQYWFGFGIYISQSGDNVIANNLVHHVPFIGITVSGSRDFQYGTSRYGEGYKAIRWKEISPAHKEEIAKGYTKGTEMTALFYPYLHARNNVIKDNEIFSAVETMGDGNAIYLSGAGTGNVIRRNFIHDIFSAGVQTALRPDDLQEQTLFSENIVYKCVYGAVEHKHDNSYVNNIFANIYPTNRNGERWDEWAYVIFGRGPNTGTSIQNNIFYDGIGTDFRFYYSRKNSPLTDALIDNNLYFSTKSAQNAQKQLANLQAAGLDMHSVVADPLFRNIANHDFILPANSPAIAMGFKAIDTRQIGIQAKWREKLLGSKLLRTQIRQSEKVDNSGGFNVTITSDNPRATIRFTTDGTVPTEASPVYKAPLPFKKPVFIRARSFLDGFDDLYECSDYLFMQE